MLKKILLSCFVVLLLAACKKNAGMYCPEINESQRTSAHLADLTQINDVHEIIDTLVKYPELQVFFVNVNDDPYDGYKAVFVSCNVFYKNLKIFDASYQISMQSYYGNHAGNPTRIQTSDTLPLKIGDISIEPAISEEKAKDIAFGAAKFVSCTKVTLGLARPPARGLIPRRLVWQIESIENHLPMVMLDAQSGQVYQVMNANGQFDKNI